MPQRVHTVYAPGALYSVHCDERNGRTACGAGEGGRARDVIYVYIQRSYVTLVSRRQDTDACCGPLDHLRTLPHPFLRPPPPGPLSNSYEYEAFRAAFDAAALSTAPRPAAVAAAVPPPPAAAALSMAAVAVRAEEAVGGRELDPSVQIVRCCYG